MKKRFFISVNNGDSKEISILSQEERNYIGTKLNQQAIVGAGYKKKG